MNIAAVLIDISNTTVQNSRIVNGIIDLVRELQIRNIKPYFVTNFLYKSSPDISVIKSHPELGSIPILAKEVVGRTKGSKKFIDYVCLNDRINQNQILYIGDDDVDMHETANTAVIFFLAAWAKSLLPYGISINHPLDIIPMLNTFFGKPIPWGYTVNGKDAKERPVNIRALFDVKHINDVPAIKRILKDKIDSNLGVWQVSDYISYHLLSSIYEEGVHLEKPLWCIYPSHNGPQTGVLQTFAHYASRMFREKFVPDLLIRGHPVASRFRSRNETRSATGSSVDPPIEDQFRSIHISPRYHDKIQGKSIIVLDDFVTSGASFEVARNFLYEAGAVNVYCIAAGKFPKPHRSYTISSTFDPFAINSEFSSGSISYTQIERRSLYDSHLKEFLSKQMQKLLTS